MFENDEKIVKSVYDLFGNYKFKTGEIAFILNGNSIETVVENRIFEVMIVAEKYKIDYDEDKDSEEELEKNVLSRENIKNYLSTNKQKIIEIFENYKTDLKEKKYVEDILKDIEEVLYIIDKMEEIKEKYNGKFEKREPKMCYSGKINNKKQFNGIKHVSVIDAEEFCRVQELLSKKKLEQ